MSNKKVNQPVSGLKNILLSLLVLIATATSLQAADYYVSIDGNNDNDGTSPSQAWQTIDRALRSVAPDQGHTIRLSAGTFNESDYLVLPSGVSLIGLGIGVTTIRINRYYDFATAENRSGYYDGKEEYADKPGYEAYYARPEFFSIQLTTGGGGTPDKYQEIANFSLTGTNLQGEIKKGHGGIFGNDVKYIRITSVEIRDFHFNAIWIPKVNHVEMSFLELKNNTFGNKYKSFGAIMYNQLNNASIHHNVITEESPNDIGAYGMTNLPIYLFPGDDKPRTYGNGEWPTLDGTGKINSSAGFTSINTSIYSNTISTPTFGTWDTGLGETAGFSIEGFGSAAGNWNIFDNILNNGISPILFESIGPIRVYNNVFDLSSYGNKYAVESNAPNFEFDHNYVIGGFLFRQTGDRSLSEEWINQKFHHNVFESPSARNPEGSGDVPHPLFEYTSFPKDFKFYNNTIYDTQGLTRLFEFDIEKKKGTGAEIRNNVFVSDRSGGLNELPGLDAFDSPDVRNNLFYKFAPFGAEAVVVDAGESASSILNLSGIKPKPFFELTPGSLAIGTGRSITDDNIPIDLGAYDYLQNSLAQPSGTLTPDQTGSAESLPVDIYPNPASTYLTVRQGNSTESIMLTFLTVSGRVIQNRQTLFNSPVSTETLTPGLYLLRVQTGQRAYTLKLLKQ
ncbi:T9SS type A sorting domain-containing protein [uncultured Fibrella sp.]|uniref:T9SS type A sorting domain-containing protein n=1 Tax=uncultured Fibrella sp. TaxID=1284596 RepID=UPI0035C98E68